MSDFKNRLSNLTNKQLILLADSLNARLEEAGRKASEPLAVIGLGCRFPGGADSPDLYWDMLADGRQGIREVPPDRWDIDAYFDSDPDEPGKMNTRWGGFLENVDRFDADFFGISPREAVTMDPQQRLLLEVAWEALENAGVNPRDLAGSPTGVYVGVCNSDYFQLLMRGEPSNIDAYFATGSAHSIASGRISYILGLEGPSLSVDTACSSSLVAVHLACQSLRLGECRLALAGGVNLILAPETTIALSKSRMMSPDGRCKTFDKAADGFVRGEGCGMIALKRLSDAEADGDHIIALILGSAANQDGRSSGITAPNGPSQAAVIRKALRNAGLEPSVVGYVEAHGTGTSLGDPIEMGALAEVFGTDSGRSSPLMVGSVKTNIGHGESAAGIAGLIKLILSVSRGQIPPHLHFHDPNPKNDWSRLPVRIPVTHETWPESYRRRIGGVSSFGFSGTNAHVIVGDAPGPAAPSPTEGGTNRCRLVAVSARDNNALRELAGRHADFLERFPHTPVPGFCGTITAGRAHHPQRAAFIARSLPEIRQRLSEIRHSEATAATFLGRVTSKHALHPVFLFTGQGSQYPGMGFDLYHAQPAFRRGLDLCDTILFPMIGRRILDLLDPLSPSASALDQTGFTQPLLFATEYALASMWRDWGVEPAAVMGHSVGEYVAACVAGLFSLEDGLRLITRRGRMMQELPDGGGMAAVFAPAEKLKGILERTNGTVSIAAVNGPFQTVISGDRKPLAEVLGTMERHGFSYEPLRVSHAFHSHLVEPILEALAAEASTVKFSPPQLPIVSNLTGEFSGNDSMCRPDYWRSHTRQAVRFAPGLSALFDAGHRHFLEIGPHPVLCTLGRQCLPDPTVTWYSSLRKGKSDQEEALENLGMLYVNGADVRWTELVEARDASQRIPLPTYPFQRKRYWYEKTDRQRTLPAEPRIPEIEAEEEIHRLLGRPVLSPALTERVFEARLSLDRLSYLNHHRIFDLWIMPTPAYLEMAMAVSEQAGMGASTSGRGWDVSDVKIEEALIFPEKDSVRVQTVFTLGGPSAGECKFFSGSASGRMVEWRRHATCRIQVSQNPSAASQGVDLNEIRTRCTSEVSVHEFYTRLQGLGLMFGSAFRGIKRIWRGDREALGEMSIPGELAPDERNYRFHPALLDACFHLLGAAMETDMREQAYLLIGIDRFRLFRTPPSHFWNLTRLRGHSSRRPESVNSDIVLFDDEGRVIAEINNLLLRRTDRNALLALTQRSATHDLLYSVGWHERPLPLIEPAREPGKTGQPEELAVQLTERLKRHAQTYGLEVYQSLLPLLDRYCGAATIRAFHEAGMNFLPGESWTREGIEKQLGLIPRHRRLLGRLLKILAEDGFLVEEDDHFLAARDKSSFEPCISPEELSRRHPECEAEIRLTERCADRLLDVLRGECDPLSLLFPDGQIESLEKIYKESPYARTFNSTLRDGVADEVGARGGAGHPINILEIGAGTGGSTAHLLPVLEGKHCRYMFTDIAPLLLARARENFKAYPFVEFETLDIEKDPEGQGIAGRHFDIVIAANVLHATRDLNETVGHVRKLMAPGGVLFLLEGTAPQRWVDLTFGLTEGWWRFEDSNLRPDYALIDRHHWERLLQHTGLRADSVTLEGPDAEDDMLPQTLVLARKPGETPDAGQEKRRWIVFRDGGGISVELSSRIKADGEDLFQVELAEYYREQSLGTLQIRPSAPEDFNRLLDLALHPSDPEPLSIVYFWDFQGVRSAHAAPGDNLEPLVHLMQAMISAAPGRSVSLKLWVVTRGAQPVPTSAALREPLQSGAWGLTRVFGLEHPDMLGGIVDLDPESTAPESAERLVSQMKADDGEDQSAVRSGGRYVPRIERVETPATSVRKVVFRKDATYLITGGLGGLGLKIAAWMSGRGAGRLVLLSRKTLPPRAEWKDISADSPSAFWVRAIQGIEAEGATVEPVSVDVSDRNAMAELFRRLKRDASSPLRGIIHAAVQMSAYPLEKLTPRALAEMMRAKVEGALLLDEFSRGTELDFFTLFSSTTSLWGVAGLAHYAAANQVLDALACRRRRDGLPAVSINWGTWEEMRIAGEEDKKLFQQVGLNPMPVNRALQVLEQVLIWPTPQICVASVDWQRLRSVYEARKKRPFFERMGQVAPAKPKSVDVGDTGELKKALEAAPKDYWSDILTEHLKRCVQLVLHLESADHAIVDRGLFDMGMDSLMAVELKSRLEKGTGLSLPPTLTFNYPTINDLAGYLMEQMAPRQAEAPLKPVDAAESASGSATRLPPAPDALTEDELSDLLARKLQELK
jgi:acyl transferase domain-containing protein/acyl carrier protein